MIFNFTKNTRKYFPKSIFARFVLIIVLPLVLSQIIYIYVFFERYLIKNNLRASELLAQEVKIIDNEFDKEYLVNISEIDIINNLKKLSTYDISFINKEIDLSNNLLKLKNKKFLKFRAENYLVNSLKELNNDNLYLIKSNLKFYDLYIKKHNGFLKIDIEKNRVIPVSPRLLLFWTILSSVILFTISFIFMKNQIKSIQTLTKTIRDFSLLEKDNEYFMPKGASEIREIGQAFLKMQKEIKKYINSRTIMLAEISHDLRTPLTRMNLEIEFIEDEEMKNNLKKDIEEMQKMINEYLIFAKGENENTAEEVDIFDFFNSIIKDYKRSGYNNITLRTDISEQNIKIKKDLFKRAINNIINNSLRYSKQIFILVVSKNNKLQIIVEDDGPGVSKEMYDKITKPFFQIKDNSTKDNLGLGLAITKNIIFKHKGRIIFDKSKNFGGLYIEINIPNCIN